ncbi:MAG TPA: T9SS type A sorting domain-containing protein [Bacteroidota bacterium]|nr:T9SS type A sorting domain-containing protein [Bacteroidota bacterium]
MMRIMRLVIALCFVTMTAVCQQILGQPLSNTTAALPGFDKIALSERGNAILHVDLTSQAPAAALSLAIDAQDLWNNGDYANAMACVQRLGSIVAPSEIEVGFQWRHPRVTPEATLLSSSVRVGEVDSAQSIALAANADASVLYCVISQQGDGHKGSWDLFVSSDGGGTWANTYTQEGTGNAPKIALLPTRYKLYVTYLPYFTMQRMRLKKFNATNGSPDTLADGTSYHDILTLSDTEKFVEIAGCSFNFEVMHLIASMNTNKLRYVIGAPENDVFWTETVDSVATAVAGGISIAVTHGAERTHGFISYRDTSGNVCIDTIHQGGWARFRCACSRPHATGMTSLSANGDTVMCTYDYNAGVADQVRYFINYDGGDGTWRSGTLQSDTTTTSGFGVPMLERGQGMGVFYRHANGPSWEGRFVYRAYPLGSIWSLPVAVTEYAPHAVRPAIIALGDRTWGIAYVVSDTPPGFGSVLFTTYHVTTTGIADKTPMEPAAFRLFQNYPNPFNPKTVVSGQWTTDSDVRLVVYDLLGREIAVLANGRYPAGRYTFTFDATNLSSGVYLYRLTAGAHSAVRKMLVLR